MTKLILHIGAPKTGTTILQKIIKDSLKYENQINYTTLNIDSSGNDKLVAYLFKEIDKKDKIAKRLNILNHNERENRKEHLRNLIEKAKLKKKEKIIITSEDLQSKLKTGELGSLSKRILPVFWSKCPLVPSTW